MRNVCVPAGEVVQAKFLDYTPPFIKENKETGRRRTGVLYERKVQAYIKREAKDVQVFPSRWIAFESAESSATRFCQPDNFLLDERERKLTIIEIKLQHCPEACDQIRLLYEPVLKYLYPEYGIAALELVQWFDAHTYFPEAFYYEPRIVEAKVGKFGIHIWNPRYDRH